MSLRPRNQVKNEVVRKTKCLLSFGMSGRSSSDHAIEGKFQGCRSVKCRSGRDVSTIGGGRAQGSTGAERIRCSGDGDGTAAWRCAGEGRAAYQGVTWSLSGMALCEATYKPYMESCCEMSGENEGNLRKLEERPKRHSPSVHAVLLMFSGGCENGSTRITKPLLCH